MKSTFKRILALVMVFCTVAAWMIPGVSAEDSAAAETPASLVVDFKTSFDNAGIAQDAYLQSGNIAPLANAYETNGWQLYVDSTGTPSKSNSAYPARAAGSRKLFQMRSDSASEIGRVPLLFKAPGTGDYTLSLTFAVNSVAAVRASLAGAFIMEAPETPYTRYNIPFHTNENAKAVISFAPNATDDEGNYIYNAGAVLSSETTVALESGKEYILIFFIQQNGDTASYADYSAFSLTPYVEVEETTAPEETTTAPEETTTVPEETWDPANNTDLVVDFGSVMSKHSLSSGAYLIESYSLYGSGPAVNAAYAAGTENFAFVAGHRMKISHVRAYSGSIKLTARNNAGAGTKHGFAIKMQSPGAGDYEISLGYIARPGNDIADNVEVYLLPMPEFDFWTSGTGYELNNLGTANPLFTDGPVVGADDLVLTATVQDASLTGAEARVATGETVVLEANTEYMAIIMITEASTYANPAVELTSLSLTEVKPAASIGSNGYPTLGDALNVAVSGDTIVLGQDAFEYEVNLPQGVIVDLNGKTLNTGAFVGTAKDSADGKGLLLSEAEAVVTAAAGQVALWDIKPSAPGYRFFNYTFSNYGVSADENNTSGVEETIKFYDYIRGFIAADAYKDENGEVLQAFGDTAWTKVVEGEKNVATVMKEDYDNGDINWRFEYCTSSYQMGKGAQGFSWGTKTMKQFGAGYTAIRFRSPGEGKIAVTVNTGDYGADQAAFDLFIVKASEVENAMADYAASAAAYLAAPATLITEYTNAINNAYAGDAAVLSGVCAGEAYNAEFEFEADAEYIAVFNITGGSRMNLKGLSFRRYEQYGMTQSFVSKLTFTNTDAYDYIATGDSGLSVGFEMIWNGVNKFFEYDDATVAAWAQAEKDNADKDYGFYIRISGFEALTESGELTGIAYMATENQWFTAEGETMTYEHTVTE